MELKKNAQLPSSMQFDCSKPLELYSCSNCNSSFTFKSELLEHLKQSHKSVESTSKTNYKCYKCTFTTFSFLILAKHVIECKLCYQPPSFSFLTTPLQPDNDLICDQPVHDVVCSLLEKPLDMRPRKEQDDIINYGRPFPVFDILSNTSTRTPFRSPSDSSVSNHESDESDTEDSLNTEYSCSNTVSHDSQFSVIYYINHTWLCGSKYMRKLYCWPCLLFSKKKDEWTKYGVDDFIYLKYHVLDHESLNSHIKCRAELEQQKRKLQMDEESTLSIASYNENVLRNRLLADMFVRLTILMLDARPENVVDFFEHMIEFMLMVAEQSPIKAYYDSVRHIFPGDINRLYTDISLCLMNYVEDHVRHEIASVPFYSIRIDDAFLITGESECSVMIRFVNQNGQLVERFLGFYEIFEDVKTLFEMIETALTNLDYKAKLVGQCYDGGKPSLILDLLQRQIKEEVRQALFVYSVEHSFYLLLQQCMKNYSTLDFVWNCNQLNKIHFIVKRIIPDWPLQPRNVYKTIRDKWNELKAALRKINDDDDDDEDWWWYRNAAYHARSLLRDMRSVYFAFSVCLFSEIFEMIRPLHEYLQRKIFDIEKLSKLVRLCYKKIDKIKNEIVFQQLYEEAKHKSEADGESRQHYRRWFFETIDNLLCELDVRFQDVIDMKFLGLANSSKFEDFSRSFPTALCENLQKHYPDLFLDVENLKSELEMFYQIEIYRGKSVEDIVKLLNQNSFHKTVFEEVYKLFCLILTLPITHKKKRNLGLIKTCSEFSTTDHLEQNLKTTEVHYQLLNELKESKNFYDDIIDRFAALNSTPANLIFKS